MEWGALLLVAVLAAGFGFVGGRAALLSDGGRRPPAEKSRADASFRVEHVEDQTWALVNEGPGRALLVSVLPFSDGLDQWPPESSAAQVRTVASELMPTLDPGQSMSVWFSRYDRGQRVLVSWTSESNVRMGPVMLELPAPR